MSQVKASGALTVCKMIKKRGARIEQEFLARLSPDSKVLLERIMVTSWITYREEGDFLIKAAELIFPNTLQGLYQLGREVSKEQFNGFYKIFLKIPRLDYIIQRVSQTWSIMHKQGIAHVGTLEKNSIDMLVIGVSALPALQREYICGYIAGVVELTGKKNVLVTKVDPKPDECCWHLRFD